VTAVRRSGEALAATAVVAGLLAGIVHAVPWLH
jgi:hypothetical protein